jgi:hypothetical protein
MSVDQLIADNMGDWIERYRAAMQREAPPRKDSGAAIQHQIEEAGAFRGWGHRYECEGPLIHAPAKIPRDAIQEAVDRRLEQFEKWRVAKHAQLEATHAVSIDVKIALAKIDLKNQQRYQELVAACASGRRRETITTLDCFPSTQCPR